MLKFEFVERVEVVYVEYPYAGLFAGDDPDPVIPVGAFPPGGDCCWVGGRGVLLGFDGWVFFSGGDRDDTPSLQRVFVRCFLWCELAVRHSGIR